MGWRRWGGSGWPGPSPSSGAVVGRRRLFDDRGRRLIDFDEAGLWREVAPPIALHREELQAILADGATGVPIRFGVTVTSIDDGPDAVRVAFDDGSSATYDLVVGADGIHSSTRRTVFGGPDARLAGQVGWRFVVDGHPGIDGWNGWLGRDRGFLALGIGGDRVYGVGDIRSTDGSIRPAAISRPSSGCSMATRSRSPRCSPAFDRRTSCGSRRSRRCRRRPGPRVGSC